jgi:hypothetical protein
MKTIKTKSIDSYQIITGIGQLAICPECTREIAKDKIAALPETAALAEKAGKQAACGQRIRSAEDSIKNIFELKKNAEIGLINAEKESDDQMYLFHKNQIKKYDKDIADYEKKRADEIRNAQLIESEMLVILPELQKKTKEIKRNNPIYFMPSQSGEYIDVGLNVSHQIGPEGHEHDELLAVQVPDGQTVDGLISKWMAKGENQQIDINGVVIPDFRGCQYYFHDGSKWIESEIITALNVTKETVVVDDFEEFAVTWDELTDEEKEEIRFQRLSDEEKKLEYTQKKSALAQAAQTMETSLKFDGIPDYVEQAQKFYNTELAILNEKYGV